LELTAQWQEPLVVRLLAGVKIVENEQCYSRQELEPLDLAVYSRQADELR
jgi:hypothetical protein